MTIAHSQVRTRSLFSLGVVVAPPDTGDDADADADALPAERTERREPLLVTRRCVRRPRAGRARLPVPPPPPPRLPAARCLALLRTRERREAPPFIQPPPLVVAAAVVVVVSSLSTRGTNAAVPGGCEWALDFCTRHTTPTCCK